MPYYRKPRISSKFYSNNNNNNSNNNGGSGGNSNISSKRKQITSVQHNVPEKIGVFKLSIKLLISVCFLHQIFSKVNAVNSICSISFSPNKGLTSHSRYRKGTAGTMRRTGTTCTLHGHAAK